MWKKRMCLKQFCLWGGWVLYCSQSRIFLWQWLPMPLFQRNDIISKKCHYFKEITITHYLLLTLWWWRICGLYTFSIEVLLLRVLSRKIRNVVSVTSSAEQSQTLGSYFPTLLGKQEVKQQVCIPLSLLIVWDRAERLL